MLFVVTKKMAKAIPGHSVRKKTVQCFLFRLDLGLLVQSAASSQASSSLSQEPQDRAFSLGMDVLGSLCVRPSRCLVLAESKVPSRQSFHEFQQRDICALVGRKPASPESTFRSIRRTVVPRSSFKHKHQIRKKLLQFPCKCHRRRLSVATQADSFAEELFNESTITSIKQSVIVFADARTAFKYPLSRPTSTKHVAPSSATTPDTLPEDLMKQ